MKDVHPPTEKCRYCDHWRPLFDALCDIYSPDWLWTLCPAADALLKKHGRPDGCGWGYWVGWVIANQNNYD